MKILIQQNIKKNQLLNDTQQGNNSLPISNELSLNLEDYELDANNFPVILVKLTEFFKENPENIKVNGIFRRCAT